MGNPHSIGSVPKIRVVRVNDHGGGSDNSQTTEYEGTKEDLIAVGIARTEMFEVGKTGIKTRGFGYPQADRFKSRLLKNGKWRVERHHELYRPPYIPDDEQYPELAYSGGVKLSLTAAFEKPIGTETTVWVTGEIMATAYVGTKKQLIAAGLAVPSMFPKKGRYTSTRKWSSPEQGEWQINFEADDRWSVTYNHRPFAIAR